MDEPVKAVPETPFVDVSSHTNPAAVNDVEIAAFAPEAAVPPTVAYKSNVVCWLDGIMKSDA